MGIGNVYIPSSLYPRNRVDEIRFTDQQNATRLASDAGAKHDHTRLRRYITRRDAPHFTSYFASC